MNPDPPGSTQPLPLPASDAGDPADPGLITSLRRYARLASVLAVAIGVVVLIGWGLDIRLLKSVVPGQVSMKANTAIAFVLSGIGLWFLLAAGSKPAYGGVVRLCAGAAAAIGLLTLTQYVTGLDFGIDLLVFRDAGPGPLPFPGRMAPATALDFLLLGTAMFLLSIRRPLRRPAQALALIALVFSVTAVVGYGCRADTLYRVWVTTAMAVHSAVAFVVLSTGVLAASAGAGIMRVITSQGVGGMTFRKLWLPSVGLLLLIGWLRMEGERSGLYGTETGLSMMIVSTMVLLSLLIWHTAANLDRLDSERERALFTIEEGRHQLTTLISNLPGVVYRCRNDADYTTEFVSDGVAELTGYPAGDFLSQRQHFGNMIHPEDRGRVRMVLEMALRMNCPFEFSYRMLTAQGGEKWIWEKGRGIHDASGRVQVLQGFFTDITERKLAEEALREREQQLLLAIRASSVGLWGWKIGEDQAWYSAECKRHLGFGDDELSDREDEWISRLHPEDRTAVLAQRDASLQEPWPHYQAEYRALHKDGSYRWIYAFAELFRDAGGRPERMLGCHVDITERKRSEQRLRESEARFRQLVEQAADGIIVYDKDDKFVLANSRACELLGYTEDELRERGIGITYVGAEQENQAKRLEAVTAGQTLRYERMIRRKGGSTFPAEISLKQVHDGHFQAIFHDITIRRAREHKIGRLTRLHMARSSINAAIVRIHDRGELLQEICRIAVKQGGFTLGWISTLDPATGKLFRMAQAGLPDHSADDGRSSGRADGLVPAGLSEVALRERRPVFDNNIEQPHDQTSVRHVAVRTGQRSAIALPLIVEGEAAGILALYVREPDFFDDAEIKLLNGLAEDISLGLEFIIKDEKVRYLSQYDSLTGLPNRSLFFEILARELADAARDGVSVALVVIDLDRFRMINDTIGREAADLLIRTIATRVTDTVDGQDAVARVGADSFAIILPGDWQTQREVRDIELRIQGWFGRPFVVGHEELRVSATTGVAVFPGDGEEPGLLFANAEAALRNAAAQNVPLRFYSAEMNARVAESLRLETGLRRALNDGELVLWYQPKVSVRTGAIIGFEALMRWQDPENGLVPPGQFIPLMEQTGLILDAGRWALAEVARNCRIWTSHGVRVPRIAVNVSPLQLRQADFVNTVIDAAAQTEAAGAMLDLEITESAIMEDVNAVITRLQTICGLGVEISIDDFGTGYSSLAYIGKLPIHALKIDRSFVAGLPEQNGSLSIVRAIISLAHSLKLQVIAEGVETEAQAALLDELGCDEMQGYLISRPMPREAVPDFLRQWKGTPGRPPRAPGRAHADA